MFTEYLQICHQQLWSKFATKPSLNTHTHTQPFSGPLSGTTQVSWHQKGKTNLDFTESRDSEWQWHQLGHKQVCTLLQTDNHASTPPLVFLQAGCPSCRPTNSVKALKAWKPSVNMHFIFSESLHYPRPNEIFVRNSGESKRSIMIDDKPHSQFNLAACLKCGKLFNSYFTTIHCQVCQWTNFKNQWSFGMDTGKKEIVSCSPCPLA